MIPILTALVLTSAADPAAAVAPRPHAPPPATAAAPAGSSLKLRFHDPRLTPVGLDLSYESAARSGDLRIGRLSFRSHELNRAETALKGFHLAATTAAFLGALNTSYDFWEEDKTAWLVGGAAALGALYGGTLGYGNDRFRVEARVHEE